jgi:hypothetical protein
MRGRNLEKEVPADARPQDRKHRRRIPWNTLRIFSAENDADAGRSFAAVESNYSDRLLGADLFVWIGPMEFWRRCRGLLAGIGIVPAAEQDVFFEI